MLAPGKKSIAKLVCSAQVMGKHLLNAGLHSHAAGHKECPSAALTLGTALVASGLPVCRSYLLKAWFCCSGTWSLYLGAHM